MVLSLPWMVLFGQSDHPDMMFSVVREGVH